tara:strand:+ start:577 stop:1284 length:708 start_codon:yes stop_codon:yes gene_type:complete
MPINSLQPDSGKLTLDQLSCPIAMRSFSADQLVISLLGHQHYLNCLQSMRHYSHHRSASSPNQVWLLEHFPVYTRGKLSQSRDILNPLPHPLVDTDRGGQITFHGPGQVVAYLLLRIDGDDRLSNLVSTIEQTMIGILSRVDIVATAHSKHRGVYVNEEKIGSIGLRMRHNYSYHGFSLNVDMDLSPFDAIHPCGRAQKMTQVSAHSTVQIVDMITLCIEEISRSWGKNGNIVIN